MKTSFFPAISVLALPVLLFVGCNINPFAAGGEEPSPADVAVDDLQHGTWHLVRLKSLDDFESGDIAIYFEEKAASIPAVGAGEEPVAGGMFMGAQIYCAPSGWYYILDEREPGAIELGLTGIRDISCGDLKDEIVNRFIGTMESVERYKISADTLRMFSAGTQEATLVFERSDVDD